MKKKTTKLFAIFFSLLMLIASLPMNVFAASSQTHNYSDISELDSKYSYGTVFWSEKSELVLTEDNTASKHLVSSAYNHYVDAKFGEVIEARLTNCAVDEDGNICDVIMRVDNIKPFDLVNQNTSDALAERHSDMQTNSEDFLRADLNVKKYPDSDLMQIWFRTNSSSADFTMKYVLSGTDKQANIHGTVATIYDIDVQKEDKIGEIWNGNEGFTVAGSDAEVYYLKNNWLVDTPDNKGVRCPDYSAGDKNFEDTNSLIPENSAVVAESFDDATFRLFYSGYSCGIAYSFASPYPFTVNSPTKDVNKTEAYEGDTLEYTVSQYIPNNYYSSKLNFIENIDNWNSLTIKDKFDECLSIIADDISISDELGSDASEYFDISVSSDNTVIATATTVALSSVDFYSHLYILKLTANIKEKAGQNTSSITNYAVTQINQTEYISNSVTTDLIFKIDTSIINGTITPSINNAASGESKTIEFHPNQDCYVSSITVDGQSVDTAAYKNGGTYSFSNINSNHKIDVVCTPYEWYNINIIYVDENDNALADPFDQSVRAETAYNVTAEANKNIQYYTLESIEGITEGTVDGNVNIIVRYVRNTNNIIINYVDKETGEHLADSLVQTLDQGASFDLSEQVNKDIQHYSIESIDNDTSGLLTEDITINVYYVKNSGKVIVKYADAEGNELVETKTLEGKVEDKYSTEAKSIDCYELIKTPDNKDGVFTEEDLTVIYVYDKIKQPPIEATVKPDKPQTTQKIEPAVSTIKEVKPTIIPNKEIKETKSPNTGNDGVNYRSFELMEICLLIFFEGIILIGVFKPKKRKGESNG